MAASLVHDEVAVGLLRLLAQQRVVDHLGRAAQALDGAGELLVGVGRLGALTGDDERRARLVDENGVHLVHDGVGMPTLHALRSADHHVVAQVVEAELGVGAVGDVGRVGGALLIKRHAVLQHAHLHAQEAVDGAHPLGVAAGQVVVHGDDVHAGAGDGVQIAGERGDERLALAGLHLGDLAGVQRHAADELDVEVAHAERADTRLAHGGERLGQQVVERLAVGKALAEHLGLMGELLIGHRLEARLEVVDRADDLLVALEVLVGAKRQQLGHESHVGSLRWAYTVGFTLAVSARQRAQGACAHERNRYRARCTGGRRKAVEGPGRWGPVRSRDRPWADRWRGPLEGANDPDARPADAPVARGNALAVDVGAQILECVIGADRDDGLARHLRALRQLRSREHRGGG